MLAYAAAAGTGTRPIHITEEDAQETYKTVGSIRAGWFSGLPEFHALEAKEGKKFDLATVKDV